MWLHIAYIICIIKTPLRASFSGAKPHNNLDLNDPPGAWNG